MPELRISPDKVCFVIVKARELDVDVDPEELDEDASPAADGDPAAPDDQEGDPAAEELSEFLSAQSAEELEDLLALMWVGQGDYTIDEWDDALDAAADVPGRRIARQLIDTPLLGDYLEEGLSEFGLSCEEVDLGHL